MNRFALIVGNNDGLQGVATDMANYVAFLKSECGGLWQTGEIEALLNTNEVCLAKYLDACRAADLDYFVFVFCGHGAMREGRTLLELSRGNIAEESIVRNVAPRQLSVFDCCRQESGAFVEPDVMNEVRCFSSGGRIGNVRQRYDNRIMQACPQHVKLYGCCEGECCADTRGGGLYSSCLLRCARNIGDKEFKTVSQANYEATVLVERQEPAQHPDISQPRCLSSQTLILSIHP